MRRLVTGTLVALALAASLVVIFSYECGLVDWYYLVYITCQPAGGGGSGAS